MKLTARQVSGNAPSRAPSLLLPWLAILAFAACNDDDPLPAPEVAGLRADDGVLTVTWDQVPDAVSYDLYWDTRPNVTPATANKVSDIQSLEYTLTGLENGETYYFALSCSLSYGTGPLCPEQSVTLPPGAVETLTITAGDNLVVLSWEDVPGATSYDLYRDNSPGVSPESAERFPDVTSPYEDHTVVNGATYYYVLQAVGSGGASRPSAQVSAAPLVPLGAPENPSVSLIEEVVNTLEIRWDPPQIGDPDSYNLYWDTEPDVTIGTNPIEGVESPYLHTGLPGRVMHYYVVTAVSDGAESLPSAEVSGEPRGNPWGGPGGPGGNGGGGDDEEGYGNNLSFPVVFAEGYGIGGLRIDGTVAPHLDHATGLRPTAEDVLEPFPFFDPETIYVLNGTDYYPQQTESTWQADWRDGAPDLQEVVVDWGDNLLAQKFTTNSVVRVETVLYFEDPDQLLDGYGMALLHGSHQTEMQGTDAVVVPTSRRHVYTVTARLRIEKLLGVGQGADPEVEPIDLAVYERFGDDGPGGYGAEINVGGKLVFGYVWMLRQMDLTEEQKAGRWRVTFSLDPKASFGDPEVQVNRGVRMVALDPSDTEAVLEQNGYATSVEFDIAP